MLDALLDVDSAVSSHDVGGPIGLSFIGAHGDQSSAASNALGIVFCIAFRNSDVDQGPDDSARRSAHPKTCQSCGQGPSCDNRPDSRDSKRRQTDQQTRAAANGGSGSGSFGNISRFGSLSACGSTFPSLVLSRHQTDGITAQTHVDEIIDNLMSFLSGIHQTYNCFSHVFSFLGGWNAPACSSGRASAFYVLRKPGLPITLLGSGNSGQETRPKIVWL
jgi:hypothetical protein